MTVPPTGFLRFRDGRRSLTWERTFRAAIVDVVDDFGASGDHHQRLRRSTEVVGIQEPSFHALHAHARQTRAGL